MNAVIQHTKIHLSDLKAQNKAKKKLFPDKASYQSYIDLDQQTANFADV